MNKKERKNRNKDFLSGLRLRAPADVSPRGAQITGGRCLL